MALPVAQLGYLPNVSVPQQSTRVKPPNPWEQLAMQVLAQAVGQGVQNVMTPDVTAQAQAEGLSVQGEARPWYQRAVQGPTTSQQQLGQLRQQKAQADLAQKGWERQAEEGIRSRLHQGQLAREAQQFQLSRDAEAQLADVDKFVRESDARTKMEQERQKFDIERDKTAQAARIKLLEEEYKLRGKLDQKDAVTLAVGMHEKAQERFATEKARYDLLKDKQPGMRPPAPVPSVQELASRLMVGLGEPTGVSGAPTASVPPAAAAPVAAAKAASAPGTEESPIVKAAREMVRAKSTPGQFFDPASVSRVPAKTLQTPAPVPAVAPASGSTELPKWLPQIDQQGVDALVNMANILSPGRQVILPPDKPKGPVDLTSDPVFKWIAEHLNPVQPRFTQPSR